MENLRDSIVEAVSSSAQELILQPFSLGNAAQNELLFFFKPECFIGTNGAQQSELIDTALNLFSEFSVTTAGALLLSGAQLAKRQLISHHYGLINRVSHSAHVLSEVELLAIRTRACVEPNTQVFGGHEFLQAFPEYDSKSLRSLWLTKNSQKLRSGVYFEVYETRSGPVLLINGFHPAQLAHYTDEGHIIVLIVLQSDLPWKALRTNMLGDTFPEKAVPGSFRRALYDNPERFGFSNVSIATNASHLSAGPFEAMLELSNFLSSSLVENFDVSTTTTWKTGVKVGVRADKLEASMSNPAVHLGGAEYALFDATEETDTLSAMHLLHSQR